jgi:hypothetical protein
MPKRKPVKRSPVPKDPTVALKERVLITPEFEFDDLPLKDLEIIHRKVLDSLKKVDTSLNDTLRRVLVQCITQDLHDPEKCTPGLYQAALRLIGEELGGADMEGVVTGMKVKELTKNLPEFDDD